MNDLVLGLLCGMCCTLGSTFISLWFASRMARIPSPLGTTYVERPTQPLPFTMTNDAQEAALERATFRSVDAPEGLGR